VFFKPLLYPLLAQILLTGLVWVYMYITRLSYIAAQDIDPQDLALRARAEPLLIPVSAPSDNLRNLFEMPVLFYTAILLALIMFIQAPLLIAMAWSYVFLRSIHSLVHITYNRVVHRFTAYFASCIVLWAMWVMIALEIIQR